MKPGVQEAMDREVQAFNEAVAEKGLRLTWNILQVGPTSEEFPEYFEEVEVLHVNTMGHLHYIRPNGERTYWCIDRTDFVRLMRLVGVKQDPLFDHQECISCYKCSKCNSYLGHDEASRALRPETCQVGLDTRGKCSSCVYF